MFRVPKFWFGLALGLLLASEQADAQMWYPRGYRGYGMSQWGANPQAGYMAGLGAYARGQGVYVLEKAKADAINLDTMLKWNKALRARQRALREEQQKEAAARQAEVEARVEQRELIDGTTLNTLLLQILDSDPGVAKTARSTAALSPAAIREIPFEWDSEALTLCVDQMTGTDSLPPTLMRPIYDDERKALRTAVERALKEDAKGSVTPETRKQIVDAVAKFRAKFVKDTPDFDTDYQESLDYFTTLASLSRLLNDASFKAFLGQLDDGRERTVGDLIAFMNTFNLRFGRATSERQMDIYRRLAPALKTIRDQAVTASAAPQAPDRTGKGLSTAAKAAFKGMSWDELEAHSHTQ